MSFYNLIILVLLFQLGCSFSMNRESLNSLAGDNLTNDDTNQQINSSKINDLILASSAIANEGDGKIVFNIKLKAIQPNDIKLMYSTKSLSAEDQIDYAAVSNQMITIEKGMDSVSVEILLKEDSLFEGKKEEFNLSLTLEEDNSTMDIVGTIEDNELCPENYILVKKDDNYIEKDFCVMKYESRLQHSDSNRTDGLIVDGNQGGGYNFSADYEKDAKNKYLPVSSPIGKPWVNIKRGFTELFPNVPAGAIQACRILNEHYGLKNEFDLISNDQWQTIARYIEFEEKNWSQGTDYGGDLNIGHAYDNPSFVVDAGDGSDPCYSMEETCDLDTWAKQKRVMFLDAQTYIWDFSGNAWEFVKDDNQTQWGDDSLIASISDDTHPQKGSLSNGPLRTAKHQFGHFANYTTEFTEGYGMANFNQAFDYPVIIRGGDFNNSGNTGVYSVVIGYDPLIKQEDYIGFRCVYVP